MNDFYNSLPMLLYRSLDTVMPTFRAIFKQFDLTEQQWRVLRVLWDEGEQPLLVLAAKTLIPSPSLVGIIDRLAQRGLVQRVRCHEDRRVVKISTSPNGQALQTQVTPMVDEAYNQLQTQLGADNWQALNHSLKTLIHTQQPSTKMGSAQ